jgi:glycerol uptake facilitator-like aquaporin
MFAAAREFDLAEVRHGKHILVVIITILGPVSGAHFNPAVSLVMAALAALEVVPRATLHPKNIVVADRGSSRLLTLTLGVIASLRS